MDKNPDTDPTFPCKSCDLECDAWDMRYCCTLCQWWEDGDIPDGYCEDCDPMDI